MRKLLVIGLLVFGTLGFSGLGFAEPGSFVSEEKKDSLRYCTYSNGETISVYHLERCPKMFDPDDDSDSDFEDE